MLEYQLYLAKIEYELSEVDLAYLGEELGINEYSLDENGKKVPLAGWKRENGYCYFFRKEKIFAYDLIKLKEKGLVLLIGREESEKLRKSLDLSQFLVEITGIVEQ